MIGAGHAYVLTRDWLGETEPAERDVAMAELARRYLTGHGHADKRDMAKWAGLPLRDIRSGLGAIASELDQQPDGLIDLVARAPVANRPPSRLLGAFDPFLLGWASRQSLLGSHQGVVTVNGIFRPIALVGGEAVGTWKMPDGSIRLTPFDAVAPDIEAALATDARDVARSSA